MLEAPERPFVARTIRWLAARSSWELFAISLAWFIVWTVAAFLVLDAIVAPDRQDDLSAVAGSMMGAVGGLFAFLTGFVIASEWTQHRDAQHTVSKEADACVRLAWASAAPHCDGTAIRTDLIAYLRSVLVDEWPRLVAGAYSSPPTHDRITELQGRIRQIASDHEVPPTVAGDLTQAVDAVSVMRADRCNLALLVAISVPFTGSLAVRPATLEHVLEDLETGRYGTVA